MESDQPNNELEESRSHHFAFDCMTESKGTIYDRNRETNQQTNQQGNGYQH